MYTYSAELYDLIYSFKNYEEEAEQILEIICEKRLDCRTILDIGCGTAEHHKFLSKHFQVDGIDLNETFVTIARQKNPGGRYELADMRSFSLEKKYDVVICLFSAIAYLDNYEDILTTLKNFNGHLNPNGLLIMEPWFNKENLPAPKVNMLTHEDENVKICRMSRSFVEGDYSILKFHYLVGNLAQGVQHFEEVHTLRLTPKAEFMRALREAGFEASFEEEGLTGRGLYFGVKL